MHTTSRVVRAAGGIGTFRRNVPSVMRSFASISEQTSGDPALADALKGLGINYDGPVYRNLR
jgi:hypothetical protein